jgi:hypothetical protein
VLHSHSKYLALLDVVFPHCLIPPRSSAGCGTDLRTPLAATPGGDLRSRNPQIRFGNDAITLALSAAELLHGHQMGGILAGRSSQRWPMLVRACRYG